MHDSPSYQFVRDYIGPERLRPSHIQGCEPDSFEHFVAQHIGQHTAVDSSTPVGDYEDAYEFAKRTVNNNYDVFLLVKVRA
jgi:hypothetical protein